MNCLLLSYERKKEASGGSPFQPQNAGCLASFNIFYTDEMSRQVQPRELAPHNPRNGRRPDERI
jgi:hypothetical protein